MAAPRKRSQSSRPGQLWRADKPYNEIPLLPPTVDLETKAILKQCIQARAALAELKGAAELIPNPSILINTLPLLEAQASSEIENIVTTTDRLFQFRELHAQADAAHSHELMNLIFELPYCRIQNVTERKIAVRQTASGYLKELVRVGVLEEKVVGREKLFIHPKLMRLLTQERNTFEPYS